MCDHAPLVMHAGTPREHLRQAAGRPRLAAITLRPSRSCLAALALRPDVAALAGWPAFALRACYAAFAGLSSITGRTAFATLACGPRRAAFARRAGRPWLRHKLLALMHSLLECELALGFPSVHVRELGLEAQIPFAHSGAELIREGIKRRVRALRAPSGIECVDAHSPSPLPGPLCLCRQQTRHPCRRRRHRRRPAWPGLPSCQPYQSGYPAPARGSLRRRPSRADPDPPAPRSHSSGGASLS